jgi:hypothetical protein
MSTLQIFQVRASFIVRFLPTSVHYAIIHGMTQRTQHEYDREIILTLAQNVKSHFLWFYTPSCK